MGLLRLVPAWAWVAVVALAWGAVQHSRATAAGARALTAERNLADTRAAAAQLAIDTLARTVAEQGEAVRESEDQAIRDRAAAAAAAGAVGRLRSAARAAAGRAGADPATASSCTAAAAAADLSADVLGRLGDAAQQLAEHAGAAARAGRLCEQSYSALSGSVSSRSSDPNHLPRNTP